MVPLEQEQEEYLRKLLAAEVNFTRFGSGQARAETGELDELLKEGVRLGVLTFRKGEAEYEEDKRSYEKERFINLTPQATEWLIGEKPELLEPRVDRR